MFSLHRTKLVLSTIPVPGNEPLLLLENRYETAHLPLPLTIPLSCGVCGVTLCRLKFDKNSRLWQIVEKCRPEVEAFVRFSPHRQTPHSLYPKSPTPSFYSCSIIFTLLVHVLHTLCTFTTDLWLSNLENNYCLRHLQTIIFFFIESQLYRHYFLN